MLVEQIDASEADMAMARYVGGEREAFAAVYEHLHSGLYVYLLGKTNDAAQTEDLLQQTFLQLHRERDRFTPGMQIRPWAFRVAANLAKDAWRKARRRERHEWRLPAPSATSYRGDEVLEASEIASRFARCLTRLPPAQRRAFERTRIDGLTLREAAEVSGRSVAAIKQLVQRAKTALRDTIEVASADGTPPRLARSGV